MYSLDVEFIPPVCDEDKGFVEQWKEMIGKKCMGASTKPKAVVSVTPSYGSSMTHAPQCSMSDQAASDARNLSPQDGLYTDKSDAGGVEFDVVLEEGETGVWIADVPVLPGCHTQGDSREEALERIKDAIRLYIEVTGTVPPRRVVTLERVSVEG
jgi:predicted RNase H-like HicB family nuclease